MTTRCKDHKKCPGGNCPGCDEGNLHCQDRNCYPHCRGCNAEQPLYGSSYNKAEDLEEQNIATDSASVPATSENSFFSENVLLTVFIVIVVLAAISYLFYYIYIKLERDPEITNTHKTLNTYPSTLEESVANVSLTPVIQNTMGATTRSNVKHIYDPQLASLMALPPPPTTIPLTNTSINNTSSINATSNNLSTITSSPRINLTKTSSPTSGRTINSSTTISPTIRTSQLSGSSLSPVPKSTIQQSTSSSISAVSPTSSGSSISSSGFTSVSPVSTSISPVSTSISPVSTSISPVSTSISPVSTSISPVSTYISPVSTYISPISTTISPISTTISSVSPVSTSISPVSTSISPVVLRNTQKSSSFVNPSINNSVVRGVNTNNNINSSSNQSKNGPFKNISPKTAIPLQNTNYLIRGFI